MDLLSSSCVRRLTANAEADLWDHPAARPCCEVLSTVQPAILT